MISHLVANIDLQKDQSVETGTLYSQKSWGHKMQPQLDAEPLRISQRSCSLILFTAEVLFYMVFCYYDCISLSNQKFWCRKNVKEAIVFFNFFNILIEHFQLNFSYLFCIDMMGISSLAILGVSPVLKPPSLGLLLLLKKHFVLP